MSEFLSSPGSTSGGSGTGAAANALTLVLALGLFTFSLLNALLGAWFIRWIKRAEHASADADNARSQLFAGSLRASEQRVPGRDTAKHRKGLEQKRFS